MSESVLETKSILLWPSRQRRQMHMMAEFKANKYILLPKVSRYTTHKVQIGCFLSVYTSVVSLEEFYDPTKEILVDELKRRVDETPHETSIIFSHQLVHEVFGGFLVHFDRGNTCSFIFLNSALVTKLILGELEWISRHFKPPWIEISWNDWL